MFTFSDSPPVPIIYLVTISNILIRKPSGIGQIHIPASDKAWILETKIRSLVVETQLSVASKAPVPYKENNHIFELQHIHQLLPL